MNNFPPIRATANTTSRVGIPRAQLEQLLAIAGPDAVFTFRNETADRPGETGQTTVTATWTVPAVTEISHIRPPAKRDQP